MYRDVNMTTIISRSLWVSPYQLPSPSFDRRIASPVGMGARSGPNEHADRAAKNGGEFCDWSPCTAPRRTAFTNKPGMAASQGRHKASREKHDTEVAGFGGYGPMQAADSVLHLDSAADL